MFHIELRKFPHSAWRFNLSEGELRAILLPWARDEWTEVGERNWNPHESKMTILEGPKLETQEIAMGRGWRNAQRRSEDITDKTLSAFRQAEHERASAMDNARIEEAARVQVAAREGSAAASAPASGAPAADPLTLGVQLAALLGSRPTELLAAWQQAAVEAPGRTPSDALAVAERALLESGETAG